MTEFPLEWLPDLPEPLQHLPRSHAMTWQRVLLAELKKVPALKIHVIVLRKHLAKDFVFERDGVTFHVLKVPGGMRAPTLFWIDTLLLKRALKKIKPDLLHAWGTERGAALVAKRLSYPYLVTIQGLMTWYAELIPLNAYERLSSYFEKISLPHAPLVTTESTFAVRYLQKKYRGLRVLQAEHAANWVFHQVQRNPQTDPLRFIFVGFLDYRKGGDLLFSALDKIRAEFTFELILIGNSAPAFLQTLKSTSSPELWNRVQIKQNLSPSQIAEELSRATMMLFPTRADTSPNAVKEAVVAGVPVVASAIGGITDYVLPDENGFTFRSENLDDFVRTLQRACRHPLFSKGLVEPASLAKTRTYLSPDLMGRRFLEAYQIVAGRAAWVDSPYIPVRPNPSVEVA